MTSEPRLDLLKALGDNTRYAIYLELARSPKPLSTSDIADTLDLHMNTVRPHLERMREVGLLEVRPDARGAVGRPQKLYSVAEDAPSLGLEPPMMPMLAEMLLGVAVDSGADREVLLSAGRRAGEKLCHRRTETGSSCSVDLAGMLDELGFDTASVVQSDGETNRTAVAFGHCPLSNLAEAEPQVICALHQGLMEGFAAEWGEGELTVERFNDLASRTPCTAELVEPIR